MILLSFDEIVKLMRFFPHTDTYNPCMYMLQFYTKNHAGGHSENKDSGIETRKFFLSCLCLLLGRFDRKRLESVVAETGMRISHVILPQVVLVLIIK